jgi:hypothetical protein
MAEPRTNTPEQYEETRNPVNPPNILLQPDVRKATIRSFLLPLVVLTVIAGLLWIFWASQPPRVRNAEETGAPTTVTGTSGERTPGGINPDPDHDRTEDELKFRGTAGSDKTGPHLRDTQIDRKK